MDALRRSSLRSRFLPLLAGLALLGAPVLQVVAGPGTFAPLAAAALSAQQAPRPTEPVRAAKGMVVSESRLASEVGRDVLAAGGNAVDAAIATGFALAVTHLTAGNIGGGGFMVVRFPNGTSTAIDFREKAPAAAHAEMFVGPDGEYSFDIHHESHRSVGVPGTVAGLDKAHRMFGKLPWERLVYPAVALAEDGYALTENQARGLAGVVERAREKGYQGTVEAYTKAGAPYQPGEILKQPDLAATLNRILLQRRDGFYKGQTAQLIAREMSRNGGLITEADLDRYEAVERRPVTGHYRGYEIISMPPPSSGGVGVIEMLNILEGFDLAAMGHNSPRYVHHLAEAMRRSYRDRAEHLADPDFVDVPVHRLTSEAHAAELRRTIQPDRATPSAIEDLAATAYESEETTHFSVVDGDGMAVSVTYTLEYGFGSGIVVPGAGFLLNNQMGDFNGKPGLTREDGLIGTTPNLARPGQRMLSSMSPSIVARDGKLVAVVGTPGGRTIINTVMQIILNVVDHRMNIQEAVNAARIHHQWLPDQITVESFGFTDPTIQALEAMGHTVRRRERQGTANCIMIDPVTGERLGAPDYRNEDAAAAGI